MALAEHAAGMNLRQFLPRFSAGIWSLSGFTFLWFLGIVVPLIGILVFSFLQTKGIKV